MKKTIGVLGVAVIAVTMFFTVNGMGHFTSDTNLASLIGMNTANAEEGDICIGCALISADVCGFIGMQTYIGYAYSSGPC